MFPSSLSYFVGGLVTFAWCLGWCGYGNRETRRDDRIQKLFASMREGLDQPNSFPDLTWEQIPALLELGGSQVPLKRFPTNPFSSRAESECPEGMIALWMVEGLRRQEGTFPSLNALCLPPNVDPSSWTAVSAGNQKRVLLAYQKWWENVKDLTPHEAAKFDPLKGTGLQWYGANR